MSGRPGSRGARYESPDPIVGEDVTTNPMASVVAFRVGAPPRIRRRPFRPRGLLDWLGVVQALALIAGYAFYILGS